MWITSLLMNSFFTLSNAGGKVWRWDFGALNNYVQIGLN